MTWSKAKEDFETALKLARSNASDLKSKTKSTLFAGDTQEIGKKKFEELKNAEQFLANLDELKGFYRNVNEKIFIDLLDATTFAVQHPGAVKEHGSQFGKSLLTACNNFEKMLKENPSNRSTALKDVETSVDYDRAAICMAGIVTAGVAIAIILGAPYALIGIAVAGLLCALLIDAFAQHNITENTQFLEDKQLNVISEFVNGFAPKVPGGKKVPEDKKDLDSDESLNPVAN